MFNSDQLSNPENLIYGMLLRRYRRKSGWTQQKLAMECLTTRESISDFERGVRCPSDDHRMRFSKVLQAKVLEYFPQYSMQKFPERLRIRFQAEKEASQYFLRELTPEKIDILNLMSDLYQRASEQGDSDLMLALDECLHIKIMNYHPDQMLKEEITRYRQDFIELFRIWIPLLDLNIVRQLDMIHLDLFTAVLEQNQNGISQALDAHLVNSLNDLETVMNLLEYSS